MDALTEKNLKALAGRSIAHVNMRSADVVEFAVPESEGWRLVVSATEDEKGKPELRAHWEPGLHCRRRPNFHGLTDRRARARRHFLRPPVRRESSRRLASGR